MKARFHTNRGFILIVVLAVLGILAMLGLALTAVMNLEKEVSHLYLDTIRARFASSSGIEYALVKIRETLATINGPLVTTPLAQSLVYYGDQTDETQQPRFDTPLRQATNPSLAVEANNGDITNNPAAMGAYDPTTKIIKVDGQNTGYSGCFEGGTYGQNADIYSLRITDANGKIYVNDGLGHAAGTANLKRILDNLGNLPAVNIPNLGTLIVNNRPSMGYQGNHALRKAFGSAADFEKVRQFVTCYAWVDNKVANPVPLSPSVLGDYPAYERPSTPAGAAKPPSYPASWGEKIYRYGRQKNRLGVANTTAITWGSNIYGWDEVNPQYIEITSRAPVNVNTAPREVLIALLQGLQGFFVMEEPKDPNQGPIAPQYAAYRIYDQFHTLDDTPATATALGWSGSLSGNTSPPYDPVTRYSYPGMIGKIYRTSPIAQPLAAMIADRIIANRSKRLGTADITASYHGPFTSWAQFNLFMDSLVQDGTIVTADAFAGQQRVFASQAIADALKANFNPNLHLNEVNPNENLYTIVDKTDLVVNSTEFCFTYRGIYEIQSLGRILRPVGTGAAEYTLESEVMTESVVKMYDVYREGTQKDFFAGEITIDGPLGQTLTDAEAHAGYRTNNNRSLETGPEPDNGLAPIENEYEGYIQLATIGGDLPVGPNGSPVQNKVHKPKGEVWETPRGGNGGLTALTMHAHFSYDYNMHHAIAADLLANDPLRRTLTYNSNKGIISIFGIPITYYNHPDWSETLAGPYSLVDTPGVTLWQAEPPGLRDFRIARSYRLAPGTGLPPTGRFFAPSDLRTDGGYIERHASAVYWPGSASSYQSTSTPASNFRTYYGTAAFWVKPGFQPELAGKPRTFFSNSKLWFRSPHYDFPPYLRNPMNFGLHFWPRNSNISDDEAGEYFGWSLDSRNHLENLNSQRVLGFGFNYSHSTGTGYNSYAYGYRQGGTWTKIMNHVGHADDSIIKDKLKAHRWTFIRLKWYKSQEQPIGINGTSWGTASQYFESSFLKPLGGDPLADPNIVVNWTLDGWGDINPVRLGEPSILVPPSRSTTVRPGYDANQLRDRNYTADGTVDEFHVWNLDTYMQDTVNGALALWKLGRYYRHNDGRFTSQDIDLRGFLAPRNLPPAIALSPDPEVIPVPDPPVTLASTPKLIGISWTQYAESYTFRNTSNPLKYILYDYSPWSTSESNPPVQLPEPQLEFKVSTNGGAAWSSVVTDSRWNTLSIPMSDPSKIKYSVKFVTNASDLNSILLASPVVDDVLLYFDTGDVVFLEYTVL